MPMSVHRPMEEGGAGLCPHPPLACRVNIDQADDEQVRHQRDSFCVAGGGAMKNSQPSSSTEGVGGASLRGTTVVDLNPTHNDDAISQ